MTTELGSLRDLPEPKETTTAVFQMTPATAGKIVAGFALCTAGMWLIDNGKKTHDPQRMVGGALLILGALAVFI